MGLIVNSFNLKDSEWRISPMVGIEFTKVRSSTVFTRAQKTKEVQWVAKNPSRKGEKFRGGLGGHFFNNIYFLKLHFCTLNNIIFFLKK